MEILIRSLKDLDAIADEIRTILNITTTNPSQERRDQRRFGVNHGGDYYLFEAVGCAFYLHRNSGEVRIPEYSDWSYYLYVEGHIDVHSSLVKPLSEHVTLVLRDAGLEVVLFESG